MRKVSLISHAYETIKRDSKTEEEEEEVVVEGARCKQEAIAWSDLSTVKTRRPNSLSRLDTSSKNTLLYMYSRDHQSKTDHLVQGLMDTRQNIVNLLMSTGRSMSFEEKRECEWDLFLVHGILEFGYSASRLKQAITHMKKQGMDP